MLMYTRQVESGKSLMLNFDMFLLSSTRIICSEMFFKISALKNFAKITGKHLHQGIFFNKAVGPKLASLSPATLLKKSPWPRCFTMSFEKLLRTVFFLEYLRWLLLYSSTEKNEPKGIPHRFLFGTVPFQSNPFFLPDQQFFWKASFNNFYNSCSQEQPPEMFYNRAVMKNFTDLESLFNKVVRLQSCNFLKKRLQHRCFPETVEKCLRAATLKNICKRLLLYLTGFFRTTVFTEVIFQNSLSNIFVSNFNFPFVSLNL